MRVEAEKERWLGGDIHSLEEINAQVREQRGGHEYDE